MQIDPIFTFIRSQIFSSVVDSRHTFSDEIYELLELAKIFYIGFRLRRILRGSCGERSFRSAPSSSVDGAEWHAGESASFHFQYRADSCLQDPRPHADPASLGRSSLLATLSAIRRAGYRVDFCGCTYVLKCNKLNRNKISEPSALEKNTLPRRSAQSYWNQLLSDPEIYIFNLILYWRLRLSLDTSFIYLCRR